MAVKEIVESINALPFTQLGELDNDALGKVYEQHMPDGLTVDVVKLNAQYREQFHEAMIRSKIMDQVIVEAPEHAEKYGNVDVSFTTPVVVFKVGGFTTGINIGGKTNAVMATAEITVPMPVTSVNACYDRLKNLWDEVTTKDTTVTTD